MAREDVSQTSAWRPTDEEAMAGSAAGAGGGESPASVGSSSDPFSERPELYALGAFAGGFVLAKVIGRLGG